MIRFALLLLAALLPVIPPPLHAQIIEQARLESWHHWRGPNANGAAPKANPPLVWDAKTNIKWKAAIPGCRSVYAVGRDG